MIAKVTVSRIIMQFTLTASISKKVLMTKEFVCYSKLLYSINFRVLGTLTMVGEDTKYRARFQSV